MRSIATKLVLGSGAVALVGVLIVALFMNRYTAGEFGSYVERGIEARDQRAADYLAERYGSGGWQGVRANLPGISHWTGMRLLVVDQAGKVVADSEGQLAVGQLPSQLSVNPGQILVDGKPVGSLYMLTPSPGRLGMMDHMMPMGGQGSMMEVALPSTGGGSEGHFLDALGRATWVAGGSALLVALLVGLGLSYRITSPVRRLTVAAGHVAAGDFDQRVPADSGDELASLGNAFNSMAESLARNERQRKQLLSDIAHELNTPITVLQGNLEAMIDGLAEPSAERLSSLREETLLLSRLVADLRDLSLAESGHLLLNVDTLRVDELLTAAVSTVQAEAQTRGVELVIRTDQPLPPVKADRDRVRQILRNLLGNALRYTPSGGSITVSATPEAVGAASYVQVTVADTGVGIPAEDLPRVFDRFFRVDRSRNRGSGGTGLGLAVVKQLVEAQGGGVRVESEPGQGATFRFTLPVA